MNRTRFDPQHGFTLVEIAVVLILLALITTALVVPIATQVEQRRFSETQRRLEEAREILLGYAVTNKRLPRPASSVSDSALPNTACTEGSATAPCTGLLPWAVLGTAKSDAWDTVIRYSVRPVFTDPPASVLTISSGSSADATKPSRRILTRDGSGNTTTLADDVVAVIWSHGARNLGTFEDGVARASIGIPGTDEQCNDQGMPSATCTLVSPQCTASFRCFFARTRTDNTAAAGGYFDDQVVWITRSQLINRLVQAGQLP